MAHAGAELIPSSHSKMFEKLEPASAEGKVENRKKLDCSI